MQRRLNSEIMFRGNSVVVCWAAGVTSFGNVLTSPFPEASTALPLQDPQLHHMTSFGNVLTSPFLTQPSWNKMLLSLILSLLSSTRPGTEASG
jgi:hypothetical protein